MGKFKEFDIIRQELEHRRVTSPDGKSGIIIPDYNQLLELLRLLKESNNEASCRNIERPESSGHSNQCELPISNAGDQVSFETT